MGTGRYSVLLIFLSTALAAGCASTPEQPYYASPVKDLGGYDPNYWIQVPPAVGSQPMVPDHAGCAVVEFTVDSNGSVWDSKVLRFIGPTGFDSWMQRYVSTFRWKPSVHNPSKIPVRMTLSTAVATQTRQSGESAEALKEDTEATVVSNQSCLANLRAIEAKS